MAGISCLDVVDEQIHALQERAIAQKARHDLNQNVEAIDRLTESVLLVARGLAILADQVPDAGG